MIWKNDWPIIGKDQGNSIGVPVETHKKPNVGKAYPVTTPLDSDEFNTTKLGLQWQWHANPSLYWGFPTPNGYFRLYCKPKPEEHISLWDTPHLLLQKWPSESFIATSKIKFSAKEEGEKIGFLIMGRDYAYLQIEKTVDDLYAALVVCKMLTKVEKRW